MQGHSRVDDRLKAHRQRGSIVNPKLIVRSTPGNTVLISIVAHRLQNGQLQVSTKKKKHFKTIILTDTIIENYISLASSTLFHPYLLYK